MLSLYRFKPRLQQLLLPMAHALGAVGVSANGVTVATAVTSVLLGAVLFVEADRPALFLLLPLWMFMRMGCNAVDGMLATQLGQKSHLGLYLNELADVFSD